MRTKIDIKYNPFVMKNRTEFLLNGNIPEVGKFSDYKDLILQSWIEHLFDDLSDACNGEKKFSLSFNGTAVDCEDMRNAVEAAKSKGFDIDYHDNHKVISEKSTSKRLNELENLMQDMEQNELYSEAIRNHRELNLARDGYLDILVVAPVSSGKSTFINALLGCDLLTTARKATTAAITEIHHNPEMKQGIFNARRFNREDEQLGQTEKLDLTNPSSAQQAKSLFSKWNQDRDRNEDIKDKTDRIQLEGCFVGIQLNNNNIKLRIYDTPGTDNEINKEHRAVTMNKIRDKENHPLIIYLLTPEKYETTGSFNLLKAISEELKKQGNLADRFIFAINRADEYFGDENPISSGIESVKSVLTTDFKIINPKVYPICSDLVKNLRIKQLNAALINEDNKDDLEKYENKILRKDERDLNRYMQLNHRVQTKLAALPDDALTRSGIPALELMISDYIEKYYEPQRIARITQALKAVIETVNPKLSTIIEMKDKTQSELDELLEKVKVAKEKFGKSKNFQYFIDKLQEKEIGLSEKTANFFTQVQNDLDRLFNAEGSKFEKSNDESQARKIVDEFIKKFNKLMQQFQANLINVNKSEQQAVLNDLNSAYSHFVTEEFGETFGDINVGIQTNLIKQVINLDQYILLSNYTELSPVPFFKKIINILLRLNNKGFEFKDETETIIHLDKMWEKVKLNIQTESELLFEKTSDNLKANSKALTKEYCEKLHDIFEEKAQGFMAVIEDDAKAPDLEQRIAEAENKLDFNKQLEATVNEVISV